jgi:hypothetical protein
MRSALTVLLTATSDHLLPPIAADLGLGLGLGLGSECSLSPATASPADTITDPTATEPPGNRTPGSLQHPGFGLALALHKAALVGVDPRPRSHASGKRPACRPAYWTGEKEHREHLFENRIEGLDFQTPAA